jgi:hypothetical protein
MSTEGKCLVPGRTLLAIEAPGMDRAARGNNGNARRSFAFAQAFACRLIPLNHALGANSSELTRTLLRIDKLGVTGSSPVPPIEKPC